MTAHEPESPDAVAPGEALVSLTALLFIEEHHLLPKEQLADAQASLRALFLRTSGQESMLRKLIDILRTTQGIHRAFARIAGILDGIRASAMTVENKLTALRNQLDSLHLSAEEHEAFAGRFLSFSQTLGNRIGAFGRALESFLEAKEEEARQHGVYLIARAARDRLRQRLASGLGADTQTELETRIKKEVVSTFDFSEAESSLRHARRESRGREQEVHAQLEEIRAMCQCAMNPAMRDKDEDIVKAAAAHDDVFRLFSRALRSHPRLLQVKDHTIELLKMYQHTYGMYAHDFQQLSQSFETMMDNPDVYFESKDEDRDIRAKREKLRRIEGLIPFLERTAETLGEEDASVHARFSRRMSEVVSLKRAPWEHIAAELLRAKIQAEAEISTRM